MKLPLLLITGWFLLPAISLPAAAQSLDPAFSTPSIYAPSGVSSTAEQPDGKLVIAGNFTRIGGSAASHISRLNANGTLDAAFQQNVGTTQQAYELWLLSTGKLLVSSGGGDLTAGGLTKPGLLRLNADGSGDATFDIGTGPTGEIVYLDEALPLPNGQTIVVGSFEAFNGIQAHGIVRLNANGTVDQSFNSGSGIAGGYAELSTVVPLPNGKFLIGGGFTSYNGIPCNGLARLNSDGSFDPTFSTSLGVQTDIINIVVQPDGKILLSGPSYFSNAGTSTTPQGLVRLLPSGAVDSGFTPPAFAPYDVYSFSGSSMQLQADGKILLLNSADMASTGVNHLARLNSNGTVDASYQVGTGPNSSPTTIQLLANGRLLVAGYFNNFNGTLDRPLLQVAPNGTVEPSFQPLIQASGSIRDIVRQTDGKLIAGGYFSEINGQAVRRLARFNTNGTLDATFVPGTSLNGNVTSLALQPDGRLLVTDAAVVQRRLTNGSLDNSFAPPNFSGSSLAKLILQPDGRLLVGGSTVRSNNTFIASGLIRLQDNGSPDASFATNSAGAGQQTAFQGMALQSNGKILVAGAYQPTSTSPTIRTVLRLESTGSVDATFANTVFTDGLFTPILTSLLVQPDGKVLVGGRFKAYGATARINLARLNADGSPDAGFVPPTITNTVNTIALQPNNRVLIGGLFNGGVLPGLLARLLPDGQADASFGTTAVPNSTVNTLLIQPDGAIVVGGAFTTINGQPAMALARLTASNVLHVAAPRAVAERTQAWPVPAHATLHVAPDASAHAQSLDLLDALGRRVRHQELTGAAPASLSLEALPAGTYLLRVTYAEGLVMRRIQVK
jgi:uncharacterized delta-60 repeat protein